MSVLLLSEVFPPMVGGSGRWLWEVYRRLPRERVLIMAGEHPRQEAFDCSHGLRVVRAPLARRSWGVLHPQSLREFVRLVSRLRGLARAEGVVAVHAGKCLPEGLAALGLRAWCGTPYVCYVHGEELNLAALSRELNWLTRRVLRRASFLIANSVNTGRILREGWGVSDDRVVIMHPGVDTGRFTPASRDPGIRDELGWCDRTVVLTVGRLQKRKGHDRMIQALGAVREVFPDILYSILGDGEERGALEDLVVRTGLGHHVQFLGECDDRTLVRCYQQSDLFVLPNRQIGGDIEGFGMVLVEAQACGKPVVAGDSGGTAETMRDPETGRIVACDDPKVLAEALIELLSDRGRLARMGAAARAWAVENFDWGVLGRQAQRLFRLDPMAGEARVSEPLWA